MSTVPPHPERAPHGHRILGVFVVVGLLAAGILLFTLFANSSSRWHCSPSQPRRSGSDAWEKVTAPAQPAEEPNAAFFAGFTISSDEYDFIVEHPSRNSPDNPFACEVRQMTPAEPLSIAGGTLALCAIGTAYLDATQTMEDDATYRFYDAKLQTITGEQASELGIQQSPESGSNFRYSPFPHVQFGFTCEGTDDLMFQGIRVFDASTKKELTSGYSSSGSRNHFRFSTQPPLWHRTPVDVVIEVSYGPSKTFEFAPRAGEGFKEGNFECRLIAVLKGVDPRSSSSSTREKTAIHKFPKAQSGQGSLRFFFACLPAASRMPVTFEFLDTNGDVLSTRGSSTSSHTHDICMEQPLKKIARIRARYRTRRERILIHLPHIPGLPEQNHAVEDLFDVYIPYVRLHDAGQVGEYLRRVLQLNASRQTGPIPANSINSIRFPVDFSDATVREIARFYAEGGDLRVDLENELLSLEYPVPLWVRLKQFLQKVIRRK